jgi:DNA-binding CsgD family transcriptional regulator
MRDVTFLHWPIMGRDCELAAFAQVWAEPRCHGVLLCGPTGVGKTRLAEAFLEQTVSAGNPSVRVTASESAGRVPFGAVSHLIPHGTDTDHAVEVFSAVAEELTGDRTTVLLVDDMHLLDRSSVVLVRQLLDAGTVRLIGTYRSRQDPGTSVHTLTGGDKDAIHRMDLGPLSSGQQRVLLETVLGRPVTEDALSRLYAASGGNPLYLRELVLGELQAGSLKCDGEIWSLASRTWRGTPQLRKLIDDRLRSVGDRDRPVLELLALHEPLSLTDAEAMSSPSALAELEAAALIRTTRERRRTMVCLAHPLYGEMLRAGIPQTRRGELLGWLAGRVMAHGARRRGDVLRLTAWQLTVHGVADPALLVEGARWARRAHDLLQVKALLRAVPEDRQTFATRMRAGEALFQAGEWAQAEKSFAIAATMASTEQERITSASMRATNLVFSDAPPHEALAILSAARRHAASRSGRTALRIQEGYVRVSAGQPARGLELLESMPIAIEEAPDVHAWLRGALMRPIALALVGRAQEAIQWAERAYAIHARVSARDLISEPVVHRVPLVIALSEGGRPAEAVRLGERSWPGLNEAEMIVRVQMAHATARAAWSAGLPATSRRWWAQGAAIARSTGHASSLRTALSGLAASAALLGDLPAAEAALAERGGLPPTVPAFVSPGEESLGDAWVAAVRGNPAAACAVLTEGAERARLNGQVASEMLLLTDVARLGAAGEVSDRLAELAGVCQGPLAPARARLAAALSSGDPGSLQAGAKELEAMGVRLPAAEAATVAATAWRRDGDHRRAAAAAHHAARLRGDCEGALTPILSRAENSAVASLSPREREIASLAAAGVTSKAIAQALTLSVRTVDNHLQRAYTKLGVTTRRELADVLTS